MPEMTGKDRRCKDDLEKVFELPRSLLFFIPNFNSPQSGVDDGYIMQFNSGRDAHCLPWCYEILDGRDEVA